jgi:PHD/YefM family antitoxin component YafN of YafNO toxin-antitoxin module
MLETAMTEPIAIEKQGRPVAVMMSMAEYQRLVEIEDRYWGERARKAVGEGFVPEKKIRTWLKKKLDAKTSR